MSYFFCESPRWFSGPLCCRYLVARFGKLRVPVLQEGATVAAEWHWALGFFRDGQFEVLGAWQDEGEGTAQRIAVDLHDRGIERIKAIAAEDRLLEAMAGLRPKACRNTTAQLVESRRLGARMQRAARWTEVAGQRLQARMSGVARRQAPFADPAAGANFIAQAFQRADRDLLRDRWDRKHPAPFGQCAFVAAMATAG